MSERIPVAVPGAAYDVIVGRDLLGGLGAALRDLESLRNAERAVVVTSPAVGRRYADPVCSAIAEAYEVHDIVVDDGEPAKNLSTLAEIYRGFAAAPLARSDVVVALGGGVIGDMAGFAAATWNRGTAVVQVPTTLLAQADASIGGKTGVNVAEGKNLVGAFHQPALVVCDVATLETLPPRELLAGLGEVAKYGFIADSDLLKLLEDRSAAIAEGDAELLREVVRRSVAVKAAVVADDTLEAGRRMLLNYGHTVGHAIEALTDYAVYRHGEAVGLGMIVAAHVGEAMQLSEPGLTQRTIGLLGRLGLPTGGVQLSLDDVLAVAARDKKRVGSSLRMVICRRPGWAEVVADPPRRAIGEALERIA